MGLVFALQPDLRKSSVDELIIRSSKKRFSLGGSFVFGAALLGTMYLAASPLFKVLWNEGNFFDQFLAAFFYAPIILYPFLTLLCWFFEEVLRFKKNPDGSFDVEAYEKFLSFRWKKRKAAAVSLSQLSIENWKGSRNVAALDAQASHNATSYATRYATRYATKGHWILKLHPTPTTELHLERRAKREEIELLKAQIESFFGKISHN